MLLGEHLGRRHQRSLVAARNGSEKAPQRHERLAGTDVALQQPVHRDRLGEVGLDLLEWPVPALPSGKMEGSRESARAVRSPTL